MPTLSPKFDLVSKAGLPRWHWQGPNSPHHRPEQPPRQMTLRRQQPAAPRVLEQPATGFPNRCSKLAGDKLSQTIARR